MPKARPFNVDQQAFEDIARQIDRDGIDPKSPAAIRARVEVLETVLEKAIRLPVRLPIIGDRVGLDAILGFLPVVGDVIGGIMSSYLIWEARNLGMSKWSLVRMGWNTLFDTAIGFVPFLGDAADVLFRSNTKNLRIVKKHLDKHHPESAIIDGDSR
ncbi:DUF4112 domain-containing protein [Pacificimonas sp. WHA3]|uniref:DUF4112 domain-containing protein n=1 Tax=Pacificimonas pallii TaxID=2827236 RepID=A0ABS6SIT8_9SPHN|nr:DUF4112 domain-containing protein [Pacificimonas pallii]MBV7257777.1 DUF4112 domain-containing protein [Pacificimonas pallii]